MPILISGYTKIPSKKPPRTMMAKWFGSSLLESEVGLEKIPDGQFN
tara:strand:- start:80 stop:217 length:138 start_codon:yes stop_codon:yes gene_type:complete